MQFRRKNRPAHGVALGVLILLACAPAAIADDDILELLTVTSQRRAHTTLETIGNIAVIDQAAVSAVAHQHIQELLTRAAGTWISRGSGQESLPAIRSPVLTGAGSCGGLLVLEDSIPIRPAGFCNVNQLFETVSEQARQIEVIRGPGNALYGSNALHGTINVLMPESDARNAAIEFGANSFARVRGTASGSAGLLSFVYADDGGFRVDSGYRQGKLHANETWDLDEGSVRLAFSATNLDQETAGFIVGQDAYLDPALSRSNPNPEAFRKADSQRLFALWESPGFELRPYLRRSDMQFLQHFLPGQPLEENGHVSAGMIFSKTIETDASVWQFGFDVEWADTFLRQTQFGPTQGSPFLQETRPEGKHYDYDVTSVGLAPWVQAEFDIGERVRLSAGLRGEYLGYDYRNNMLPGNTRDDGTVCGFGGCLYTRPEDRHDSFTNVAPKLGLRFVTGERSRLFVTASRGFRAPQMTELYRLQSGQQVADLDSEELDAVELGWRSGTDSVVTELAAYWMRKRNSVLRDADGFNVSGARSRHEGIEASVDWRMSDAWLVKVNSSYGRHQYDFDLVAARGETFVKGNDVDTAPRWLGSAELIYGTEDSFRIAALWTLLGRYYVDAENRFTYPGHDLVNLRATFPLGSDFRLSFRLNNALDEHYADRADFAFGNYRYFPGRGRELFVELRYE